VRRLANALNGALLLSIVCGCSSGTGTTTLPAVQPAQAALPRIAAAAALSASGATALARRVPAAFTTDGQSAAHVKTWAYWGQAGEPAGVTPQFIAQNVTFLEADAAHVLPYHAAGGSYAVRYTDPNRVIPGRKEELWNTPEQGWFHDASGKRIWLNYGAAWGIQNVLNPASAVTRSAYTALTQQIAASAPYDYVEVDDTNFDLAGAFYGFNTAGVEAGSQSAYDTAVDQLLDASAVRPILNGLSNEDGHPGGVSGTTAFLSHAEGGIDNEGCLQSTYQKTETQWQFDENTMLATARAHKLAVCWGRSSVSGDTHPLRLYFAGSWWLTYDPTYSVAFANFASIHDLFVFPEYDIVPTRPLQSPSSNVTELKSASGVYVREFAQCYQRTVPIGACAAFVNPTGSTLPLPTRAASYPRSLVLDQYNSFDGGRATWTANAAQRLAPFSAIIVAGAVTTVLAPAPNPTPTPAPRPTSTPTPSPTATPTPNSTAAPAPRPTATPTPHPTAAPTPRPTATPTARPTATPAPTPSPAATPLAVSGTIETVSSSALLFKSTACGYLTVGYGSSTSVQLNGYALVPGALATVTGTGSCSTQVAARRISLTGVSVATVTGTVKTVNPTYFYLGQSSCGAINVFYDAATKFSGPAVVAGSTISATGTGSCSSRITATAIGPVPPIGLVAPSLTTVSGSVASVDPTYLVVQTGTACGLTNVFFDTATAFSGPSPAVGQRITATGTGSCSTHLRAANVVLSAR
jgi:hypothetical protein